MWGLPNLPVNRDGLANISNLQLYIDAPVGVLGDQDPGFDQDRERRGADGDSVDPRLQVLHEEYAAAIRAVGPAHCILSSDLGQAGNPLHPDGLTAFFAGLRKQGISQSDIDLMSKTNPARVLGLQ